LMVSPIPYHSFKNVRFGRSYSATVIPVIVSILLIIEPGLNFFLVGLAYVVSGPAGHVWRWQTGRALEPMVGKGLPGASLASSAASSADSSSASSSASPESDSPPNVTSLSERMVAADQASEKGDA